MSDTQNEVQVQDKQESFPIISVQGAGNDNKVVLWEKHKDHPTKHPNRPNEELGEAFVVNDGKPVEVAETPLVKRLIAEGVLLRVNWNSRKPSKSGQQEGLFIQEDEPEDNGSIRPIPSATGFTAGDKPKAKMK